MNIETLAEIIREFDYQIVESGFRRDLQDYTASLPSNQNNIVALRDIANKINERLHLIENSDLPDQLEKLLKTSQPFTNSDAVTNLRGLMEDKSIDQAAFFQRLHAIINTLSPSIQTNIDEIEKIKAFIKPYLSGEALVLSESLKAVVGIIFNDKKTVTNLTEFTKNLNSWNRDIKIYHQLVKASPPEDIGISSIESGSIDLIVNIDVDVAVNLIDLFNFGFKAYFAYLSYKKLVKPISEMMVLFANKKLDQLEQDKEEQLLINIEDSINNKVLEQHQQAKEKYNKIDTTSVDEKVKQVTKLVLSHIVKGNDVKLLAYPTSKVEEDNDENEKKKTDILKTSQEVRSISKELPHVSQKLLLMYGEPEDKDTNRVEPPSKKQKK